jgi:DDE superfamily endonuclease/Winged helix-turn helix
MGYYKGETLTQQTIANRIYEETGQKVNQSTISRALKKRNITYKKGTKQFTEQDLKKAKQFITDNYHLLSLPSLYALDECGFNLEAVPHYAYARKGRRAIISRPGKRSPNYTLILCIQNVKKQAVVGYKLITPDKPDKKIKKKKRAVVKKGTKAENFHDFLKSIDFPANQENCLLLDNAKIHHANQACIKKNRLPIKELAIIKKLILKYLVAYSPQLNPVELCFNFIRQYIEQCQARTEEKLKLAIEEAIALLQEQDLTQ